MPSFDRSFLESAMKRFENIESDRQPEWGVMTPAQMRAHLKTAIRYSLGKEERSPDERNWLISTFVLPLLLNGWIKMPKNVKRPKLYDVAPPEATNDEVRSEMEAFLAAYEAGDFEPPPHPSLGNLGMKGWAKLHVVHCDHHLRQFGV